MAQSKMSNEIIIELIPAADMVSIIPLLRVLNEAIPEQTLRQRLDEMVAQGYQCAGMYLHGKLIGICGLWILTKYYVGRHIEPDNVVILPEHRCKGLGKQLLAWVYEYGKAQGCIASELNCYLTNQRGQLFWEKEGYKKIGYHYQRSLAEG